MNRHSAVGLLAILAACGGAPPVAQPPVASRPIQDVFRLLRRVELAPDPADTVGLPAQGLAAPGGVIVVDAAQADLKEFDPGTGRLIRVVGKPGDRRGEFRSPIAIAPFGQTQYGVLDDRRRVLSVWDTAGAFVRDIEIPGFWVSVAALPSQHRIVLSGTPAVGPGVRGIDMEIHELDDSGHILTSYRKSGAPTSMWKATLNHAFFAIKGNVIVSGTFAGNALQVYDRQTGTTREFSVAPGWYHPIVWPTERNEPPGATGVAKVNSWLRTLRLMMGLTPLDEGRLVVRFESYLPSGAKVYNYAVCDTTGRTIALTEATRQRVIASRGDTLYSIEVVPGAAPSLSTWVFQNGLKRP